MFSEIALKELDKFYVGFDEQIKRLNKYNADITKTIATNYPPYNIKKVDDNKYVIELAVAGFNKTDIEVSFEEDKLVIEGNTTQEASDKETDYFLFRGIAKRSFTRTFMLSDFLEIRGAEMVNGMLQVLLEKIVPEEKKPKKISIK